MSLKWTKLSLQTTTEAVDLVSNMLDDMGIVGIEIEDNVAITQEEKEQLFIGILPELEPDDGIAIASFYVEETENIEKLLEKVKSGLKELSQYVEIGTGEITVSETEDKDWINNWKEFFKPFRVDDDIVIKPTWEPLEHVRKTDIVIEIDPGTAFGTGSHETTKLCILGLKKYINSESTLLDVGCGSGILSILGLKLGAKSAVGIDIDPIAIEATKENAEVNNILGEHFTILGGNIIEDSKIQQQIGMEKYNIVVANILADVIIPLSTEIGQHLQPGGFFITSGIINTKKKEVKAALLSAGFELVEAHEMGEWISFVVRKPLGKDIG